ncbi:thiosulfate sulfurtransferase [Oceanisphaera profunda]|uniref:Thiosulfate sulfurtransferase GlpE n=1 Tax=Oceanisphaera profunda TaxID=1416627 RepID=A0A1Y0D566_9GAMM|nr:MULTISPECIES: thiosulfate sulfurtransferase GlpE [Oceanisphaera]ART82326.1 thiosulfate sulfurtransferase [Oceanisphaera profunda]
MEQFAHISVDEAQNLLAQGQARLVDTRDPQSFALAHVEQSYHLTNDTLVAFTNEVDYETPIIVMCYHGVSSQGAAQYLIEQGFEEVYSLDGGFEAWRRTQPVVAA